MRKLLCIVLLGILFTAKAMEESKRSGSHYTLPIGSHGDFFQIIIPDGFVSQEKNILSESFIKKDYYSADGWSERITTQLYLSGEPAEILLKLKTTISDLATNVQVKYISVEVVQEKFCTIGTAILSYTRENRRRVVYARVIAQLMQPTCSGFKYTIDATNKDERTIVKQLKEFAEEKTKLVQYGH